MNPADVCFEDGGESMWEDAGEEDDCDFAGDNVDGKDLCDPEVKELMSEIMGKDETDEVLDQASFQKAFDFNIPSTLSNEHTHEVQVKDPPETEKMRVHLPELAPQSLPHAENTTNKARVSYLLSNHRHSSENVKCREKLRRRYLFVLVSRT